MKAKLKLSRLLPCLPKATQEALESEGFFDVRPKEV